MIFQDKGIFGFDVSFYQDDNQTPQQIDFVKMKNYGASFVIIKAGQNNFPDPDFTYNWKKAKEAGLPRAAYWFLDVYTTGKAQAQLCWSLLKSDPPEGPIFVDFERNLQGFIANWQEVYNFIVELQTLSDLPNEKIGIYTGYYIWIDYGPIEKSQKDWFQKYPLWLAWYSSNPSVVYIPYPWTECVIWQDGTPAIGLAAGVESKEIDHDKLNGGADALLKVFGYATPVVHTQPSPGFDEFVEIVNGVKCHVSLIDLTDKQIKIRHFNGSLGMVSNVGKEPSVLCAFNGEDYNKKALEKYYPKHPSYSEGIPYKFTEKDELPYWINFSKTNTIKADYRNPTEPFWNSVSFIRPLVIGGQTAPDIVANPTKIEYTEIHACSGLGFTADGRLIQIVAEGKVDPNTGVAYKGITVPQLVDLFKKYQTIFAGQHGGGGDSGKSIAGIMVNEPSDPTERPVVQVIEILGKGETNMNGVAKEKLGKISTIRYQPSRYGADTGKRVYAYSSIEFTEIVPVTTMGTADNPNDKWLKLPDGTYVNYILSGVEYYTIISMPSADIPPATEDVFEVYKNGQLILKLVGKIEVLVQ